MAEVGLVAFAQCALQTAETLLPKYRSKFSKHLYTQPQRLTIPGLMCYVVRDQATVPIIKTTTKIHLNGLIEESFAIAFQQILTISDFRSSTRESSAFAVSHPTRTRAELPGSPCAIQTSARRSAPSKSHRI